MPFHYDITQDAMYQQGKLDGKAEGKAEGMAQGIAEGKAEGMAQGIAEGIAEGRKIAAEKRRTKEIYHIVHTGNSMGLSKQQLAQLAHSSLEEVEKVLKKIKEEKTK